MAQPTWPGHWDDDQLEALGRFIMLTANPYRHSAEKVQPPNEVLYDNGQLLWSFRNTPLRVEKSMQIPYWVWYPKTKYPDPKNPADWERSSPKPESILVGYVGAGGW
jgi:hypothetical protein